MIHQEIRLERERLQRLVKSESYKATFLFSRSSIFPSTNYLFSILYFRQQTGSLLPIADSMSLSAAHHRSQGPHYNGDFHVDDHPGVCNTLADHEHLWQDVENK